MLMAATAVAAHPRPVLPRQPTIYGGQVVFVYGDRLWSVGLNGGKAQPLTSGAGIASHPHFSPDGDWIAFSLKEHNNVSVYLMPATGGVSTRLTWRPGNNVVVGWTRDGKSVLFRSPRASDSPRYDRLFTIPVTGGLPQQVPLPMAEGGSYSPEGQYIAYVPFTYMNPNEAFKHYKGGLQARIWIARLSDSSITRIPRSDSQDFDPMWIGHEIYFLSDRNNGVVTLYRYNTQSRNVIEVLPAKGPDIKSASTDGSKIIYATVGALHVLDLATGKTRRVTLDITGDFPHLQPHFVKVANQIVRAGVSPTGVRAVFAAHGDILTVPVKHGNIRNITRSPGADDRYPAWSPNGKWIAYFSDRSGGNELYLSPQDGLEPAKAINLGHPNLFYYSPVWSPDNKKIAYTDQFHNLWYVNLTTGKSVKVATDYYYSINPVLGRPTFDPVFSPDSHFLAYARLMPNHMREVFIYALKTGKSRPVSNNLADERYIAWDKNGKYLYFTASTTIGPATGWGYMSSYKRPVTRHVYAVVLRKGQLSPLAPRPGNDRGANHKGSKGRKSNKASKPVRMKIDFNGISRRIAALPIPAKHIVGLQAGRCGVLFVTVGKHFYAPVTPGGPIGPLHTVYKFDLGNLHTTKLLSGVRAFHVSADGKFVLYAKPHAGGGNNWFIAGTSSSPKPSGARKLDVSDLTVWVEPRVEWEEMYRQEWRIIRNFFYDKNLHGLNSREAEKLYLPYVKNLVSKRGLYYIFNDMRGDLVNSHVFMGNPFSRQPKQPATGLLGANYVIAHGRYRFARIFTGGDWNPELHAPLALAGLDVHAGDYLLAVNGRKLTSQENIYSFFQGTAGKQTTLKVGPDPNGNDAHTIVVVPIRREARLRQAAWVQGNLRKVDQLSHGKIAYVYLPNTGPAGYRNFNRYFFAQIQKPALIIDERFNGGGFSSDYIIGYLRRILLNYWETRHGHVWKGPEGAIFGPKAMLINGYAVSGGDELAWDFQQLHIGPLIGMKTTGGLNAIAGVPRLVDGTFTSVPRQAIYGSQGRHVVENIGVAPDIRVPLSPKAWRQGKDSQLRKAVDVVLKLLKEHPVKFVEPPPFKNYHQHPAVTPPIATGPSPIGNHG